MGAARSDTQEGLGIIMSYEVVGIQRHSIMSVIGIFSQLFSVDARWAIMGSANLAIRGADIQPSDIDIITTSEAADKLASSIGDIAHLNFTLSGSETIQSYYGTTKVSGISIDIMADVKIFTKHGTWQRLDAWNKSIEYIPTETGLLPLTTLAFERNVYLLLGNIDRVQKIDAISGIAA
jgi:hypothetical protein